MRKLSILLIALGPSVFAQTLNWPKQGYLEDWGFQRPNGCQPGDGYILEWARKFEQVYSATNITTVNTASKRQNLEGGGSYNFIQAIRTRGLQSSEGRALAQLIQRLNNDEAEHLRIAKDYLSLRAGGGSPSSVVNSVRRFEISDSSCFRGTGGSASGSLLCGLAAKMVEHTIQLENAVQIACHAGLPIPSTTGSGRAAGGSVSPSSSADSSPLDAPERLQAAQANQQQADRAFAGKRRAHDDNANTEQPTNGPRENTVTNRGPVRVNVAYCLDSHKRAYSGSLKCSAQRFGYTSVEVGQTVEVLPPNSGQQALTFSCKHPAKPYDVEFANDGLSGRCAAY